MKNSEQLFENYTKFHMIQNDASMPDIVDMKLKYADKQEDGMKTWWTMLATGSLVNKLNKWARGFRLPVTPQFAFAGKLGYENTLPDTKLVGVDFPPSQDPPYTITALGYADLLKKLNAMRGYGYCPLIIRPVGGENGDTTEVFIAVDRSDPRHTPKKPVLKMRYRAKGYFMTKGWDPAGTSAEANITTAKNTMTSPPTKEPVRTEFTNGPCPKVLWYFEIKDLKPGLD